jgi:3'-phosphoadenosine 5'-phosphosulfate sulfotransferase (PAPS reductase)/FAD synthetase
MYVIHGNYGNHTVALMQWALEQNLSNVFVVSIETGWAASIWAKRVEEGEGLARSYGFNPVRLASSADFISLVKDRKEFPSQKFQWCSSFLKGLTLLEWLDKHDPNGEAIIIYGKRREDSRLNLHLQEYIEASAHHNDRKVWYPLYQREHYQFLACHPRAKLSKNFLH